MAEEIFNNSVPFYTANKKRLDKVGCGFCLAKWTQVTIHLHTGRNHSCHHPATHPIPVHEVKRNPSALHNTLHKKRRRREMLTGKRPKECDYCWNVEDNSKEYSDRIYKSSESWSRPFYKEIVDTPWNADYFPKYVEVSFSNVCNFKCSYCGPSYSSQWVAESAKHGPYPTTTKFNGLDHLKEIGEMPIHHKEHNPYVEAFWKWWPDLYHNLHTFRMTGGEPLLSKDVWKVLDYIEKTDNPNRMLKLSINTNLGAEDRLIDKLIKKINRIRDEQRCEEFVIFTSVDGWGKQAEYGRNGLEFDRWWNNVRKILSKCPTVSIGLMSTYNALSVFSFPKLIKEVYELKKEFASTDRDWVSSVFLDASYLRYPTHQTIQVLGGEFADLVKKQGEMVKELREVFHQDINENGVSYGFTDVEIGKITRLYDWMIAPQDENQLLTNQKNFYRFFNAHDERRGTNFLKTFPELKEFYNKCKELNND